MNYILCPNCDQLLDLYAEYEYSADSYQRYRCINLLCSGFKNGGNKSLLFTKNNKDIVFYKIPVIHDDGLTYIIYSTADSNRTTVICNLNRIVVVEKFYALDLNKSLNNQLYLILKKLLKLKNFK